MSKYLLVGNWKMNPQKEVDVKKKISDFKKHSKGLRGVDVVICPPHVFIQSASRFCSGSISLGAQDMFWKKEGSYTGETSPEMLRGFDVQYVIIGHSERRELGETNEIVAQKTSAALESRILPIVCVGEKTRDEEGKYLDEIKTQLTESLRKVPKTKIDSVVIAYEPVWAIGASSAMDSHEMHQMTLFIKKTLIKMFSRKVADKIRVLYGGSITEDNARDMIELGNVDGLLVGRASLDPKQFALIYKNISNAKRRF